MRITLRHKKIQYYVTKYKTVRIVIITGIRIPRVLRHTPQPIHLPHVYIVYATYT